MLKAFGVNKSYLKRRIPGEYDANLLGLNYRMNEISAAIGIEQIKRFPKFLAALIIFVSEDETTRSKIIFTEFERIFKSPSYLAGVALIKRS